MQVARDKVVTIDYTLKDDSGKVIDRSEGGNFSYLHGANNIIPGLEKALAGKSAGDEVSVSLQPDEGYGHRNESLKQVVSKDMFQTQEDIEIGRQFYAQSPDGQQLIITVTEVSGAEITIDANHPLAGVNLNFDVRVIDVRDATEEEISHSHVHGEGHEHH
jgi:FKBP-type peptidyl-prolyl cis-trans isomerase SlyD